MQERNANGVGGGLRPSRRFGFRPAFVVPPPWTVERTAAAEEHTCVGSLYLHVLTGFLATGLRSRSTGKWRRRSPIGTRPAEQADGSNSTPALLAAERLQGVWATRSGERAAGGDFGGSTPDSSSPHSVQAVRGDSANGLSFRHLFRIGSVRRTSLRKTSVTPCFEEPV